MSIFIGRTSLYLLVSNWGEFTRNWSNVIKTDQTEQWHAKNLMTFGLCKLHAYSNQLGKYGDTFNKWRLLCDLRSCLMALWKITHMCWGIGWQRGRWAESSLRMLTDWNRKLQVTTKLGGYFSRFPLTRRTGFQSHPGTKKDYSENNTEETIYFKQMWLSLEEFFYFLIFSLTLKIIQKELHI